MGETAHQLHTLVSESPASIGMSANLNLSPRSLEVCGQTPTNPDKSVDLLGQQGTGRDTVCRAFASKTTETAHELHTQGASTAHAELNQRLGQRLNLRLAQLELLPGSISGKGIERTSAGVDRQLPVTDNGRARGDMGVYTMRKRVANAKTTRARALVLRDIVDEVEQVTVSRKQGWYDLGTAEGRHKAGRLAAEHGVAYACRSLGVPRRTMYRYRDEFLGAK